MRRRGLVVLAGLAPLAGPASAQAFPSRPLRMIVPYLPGGSTDVLARFYAAQMSERLGQPVVVENRPGGGTLVGIRAAAAAVADGYTMLFTTSAVAMNVLTDSAAGYRLDDFVAVGPAGEFPYVLLVPNSVPAHSLAELVTYGRDHPGRLNFSSLGRSTPTALLASRFLAAAGIDGVEVTYSGSAAAMNDVLAGTVHMIFTGAQAINFATAGTRALGVTSERRVPIAPDVPTFAERGFPTLIGGTWFGIFCPAATPEASVRRLSAALEQAALALKPRLAEFGVLPIPGNVAAFPEYIRRDQDRWTEDLRRRGLLVR